MRRRYEQLVSLEARLAETVLRLRFEMAALRAHLRRGMLLQGTRQRMRRRRAGRPVGIGSRGYLRYNHAGVPECFTKLPLT